MNVRYQRQALEHLRDLAGKDEPFFLQYWPLYPLTGPRTTMDQYTAPNGGTYVETMKLLDTWIGAKSWLKWRTWESLRIPC